jgi:hypothetical protein
MTTYGYARVSTNGQDLAAQEAELLTADCNNRCLMRTKLLAGVAVLSLLLASAALAGQCQTYCGEFAGFRWCNTKCR